MLSFLLSFALAADIPVGARVVLPASAPVSTPAGKPLLASASGTWGARVVQDLGDRLVVEPEGNDCQRSLTMSPPVSLRVMVEEAALLTLTTRPLSGKGSAGEEWRLASGVVVQNGLVDLGAVGRLRLPILTASLRTWTTEALLPVTFPEGDQRVGPPRGTLMFLGEPLSVVDDLTIHQEGNRVYWKGACGGISFFLPSNVPFGEATGAVGGLIGSLSSFPTAKVPAGTTLRWPDGEEAGKTKEEIRLQNAHQTEGVWCGDFSLEGGKFQLCDCCRWNGKQCGSEEDHPQQSHDRNLYGSCIPADVIPQTRRGRPRDCELPLLLCSLRKNLR